jgi:hypothetical protein
MLQRAALLCLRASGHGHERTSRAFNALASLQLSLGTRGAAEPAVTHNAAESKRLSRSGSNKRKESVR